MGWRWGLLAMSLAAAGAVEVPFADLPKPVQRTINRNLDGGAVQKVERISNESGTTYEVLIRHDTNAPRMVRIDSTGKRVDSPEPVRVTLR